MNVFGRLLFLIAATHFVGSHTEAAECTSDYLIKGYLACSGQKTVVHKKMMSDPRCGDEETYQTCMVSYTARTRVVYRGEFNESNPSYKAGEVNCRNWMSNPAIFDRVVNEAMKRKLEYYPHAFDQNLRNNIQYYYANYYGAGKRNVYKNECTYDVEIVKNVTEPNYYCGYKHKTCEISTSTLEDVYEPAPHCPLDKFRLSIVARNEFETANQKQLTVFEDENYGWKKFCAVASEVKENNFEQRKAKIETLISNREWVEKTDIVAPGDMIKGFGKSQKPSTTLVSSRVLLEIVRLMAMNQDVRLKVFEKRLITGNRNLDELYKDLAKNNLEEEMARVESYFPSSREIVARANVQSYSDLPESLYRFLYPKGVVLTEDQLQDIRRRIAMNPSTVQSRELEVYTLARLAAVRANQSDIFGLVDLKLRFGTSEFNPETLSHELAPIIRVDEKQLRIKLQSELDKRREIRTWANGFISTRVQALVSQNQGLKAELWVEVDRASKDKSLSARATLLSYKALLDGNDIEFMKLAQTALSNLSQSKNLVEDKASFQAMIARAKDSTEVLRKIKTRIDERVLELESAKTVFAEIQMLSESADLSDQSFASVFSLIANLEGVPGTEEGILATLYAEVTRSLNGFKSALESLPREM